MLATRQRRRALVLVFHRRDRRPRGPSVHCLRRVAPHSGTLSSSSRSRTTRCSPPRDRPMKRSLALFKSAAAEELIREREEALAPNAARRRHRPRCVTVAHGGVRRESLSRDQSARPAVAIASPPSDKSSRSSAPRCGATRRRTRHASTRRTRLRRRRDEQLEPQRPGWNRRYHPFERTGDDEQQGRCRDETHGPPAVLNERTSSFGPGSNSPEAISNPPPPAMQIALSSRTPCGATNATSSERIPFDA